MSVDEPLPIGEAFVIPAGELSWSFDPSGGPGGQHANKAATRAELSFDLAGSPSIPEEVRELLLERLGNRISGGVLSISVDESRSQWRNRAIARKRLTELLEQALRPRKRRVRTKPGRAARARRLERKKQRAEIKRLRRPPERE